MKLYKTTSTDLHGAKFTKWAGSLAGATADRGALKETSGVKGKTIDVDVPTDKVGLLAWLNKEAS